MIKNICQNWQRACKCSRNWFLENRSLAVTCSRRSLAVTCGHFGGHLRSLASGGHLRSLGRSLAVTRSRWSLRRSLAVTSAGACGQSPVTVYTGWCSMWEKVWAFCRSENSWYFPGLENIRHFPGHSSYLPTAQPARSMKTWCKNLKFLSYIPGALTTSMCSRSDC